VHTYGLVPDRINKSVSLLKLYGLEEWLFWAGDAIKCAMLLLKQTTDNEGTKRRAAIQQEQPAYNSIVYYVTFHPL
jgi:hypothetical protein